MLWFNRQDVGWVNVYLLFVKEWCAVLLVAVEIAGGGIAARIGEIDIACVGRDVELVRRLYLLEFLRYGIAEYSIGNSLLRRVYGLHIILVSACVVGEGRANGVEECAIGGVVGAGEIEGGALVGLAVDYDRSGRGVVVVTRRVHAEVLPRLRHLAVEVYLACVYHLDGLHLLCVNHLHGGLVVVLFGESVAASVSHIEPSFVKAHSFWLPSGLTSGYHLLCPDINLRYIALLECLRTAFVSVAGDVEVVAVAAHSAVVRHILRRSASFAVGVDVLDDVAPVDGNGYQRVVHLDDVVWRVAKLDAVDGTEPLVCECSGIAVVEG